MERKCYYTGLGIMNEFTKGKRTLVTAGSYVGRVAVRIEKKLKETTESNTSTEKINHLQCIPEEEVDDYCDKENSYTRATSSRTSFYCRKFENLTFDPKKPLTNPFRMSHHDQMPVQVLPVPPRAVSMNDMMTEPCRMNSCSSKENISEPMDCSMMSSCTLDPDFEAGSQSLNRMQLRSSKKQNYENFRPNFGALSHGTKLKSRSEYFLRSSQCECEFSKKKDDLRVFESSRTVGSKKSNLRTRIQKKFGSTKKVEKDPVTREKKSHSRRSMIFLTKSKISSPRKRRSIGNFRKISQPLSVKKDDFVRESSSSNTLSEVLKSPDICEEFRLFLRSEHSEENLDFWLICEEYKKTNDQSALAKIIFKHFISSGASREVNLDGKTKSILELNMKNLNRSSFVPAQECVYRLMVQDSFRRFMIMRKRTSLR